LARVATGHSGAETPKTVFGHGGNEGPPILEMPVRRCLTHSCCARYRAKSQSLGTLLPQDLNRSIDESLSQITMVIGASG
jgi:hypothetical protein